MKRYTHTITVNRQVQPKYSKAEREKKTQQKKEMIFCTIYFITEQLKKYITLVVK